MKSFLEYVSADIINKFGHNLSRTIVVFPNKRASLFMNECLVKIADRPIWSPIYITISDLFCRHSSLALGDPIKLICELHKSFVKYSGTNESLDHFYGWGQLLLSDFDDIDKSMADASKVFANLKNIHELDDISYLTQNQKDILKKFFINFNENSPSELKKRFLSLWQQFENIYIDYNTRLRELGISYEGALYKSVATDENINFEFDRYIFVGFNMLHKVERVMFDRLKKSGKAFFYWDFDKYYMPNKNNTHCEAGHYISQYLQDYPNELDTTDENIYANLCKSKNITFVTASTANAQARYATDWLLKKNRIADGVKTAIIMCDESMLQPLLYSMPPEIEKMNITTGYPLSISPIWTLVQNLFDMHSAGNKGNHERLSLRQVNRVLRHPYCRFISERASDIYNYLNAHKIYYPERKMLSVDESLTTLFCNIDSNPRYQSEHERPNLRLLKWIMEIMSILGMNCKNSADNLTQESIFRMYAVLSRLASLVDSGDLCVDTITLRRLIRQIVESTSIPFHGEPAIGVQIMGVLETRNLDFEHILLLSCNDGMMPKGVNDASFIPYSIRKAYGLTTIDNKIAIYSYYFHRILQRASDITIAYNNADTTVGGEMSRFMLQLMIESPHVIQRESLQAGCASALSAPRSITKTEEVMHVLNEMKHISPSAVNQYLRCQLQFFYNYVAQIKEPNINDDDSVDNRIFGNIFHKAAFYIYKDMAGSDNIIRSTTIDQFLKDPHIIGSYVDKAFRDELFKIKEGSRMPEYNGLQIINREVIIGYLRRLMSIDRAQAPFSILKLEESVYAPFSISTSTGQHSIMIGGIIDRLDMLGDGSERIRVLDYKTGRQPSNFVNSVEEIFATKTLESKHNDYYLQVILYSLIVSSSPHFGNNQHDVSPALYFIRSSMMPDYNPTLSLSKKRIDDVRPFAKEFKQRMESLLSEIFEQEVPFSPTDVASRCVSCPYKAICDL